MKCYPETEKAVRLTVKLSDDVQQYALDFLHIFNNVREHPDMLYKLENLEGTNLVFVTCCPGDVDAARWYLSQFGKITEEEIIYLVRIQVDFNWDLLDGDISDVLFLAEEY